MPNSCISSLKCKALPPQFLNRNLCIGMKSCLTILTAVSYSITVSTDNPLTARYQRDELGCHETTDKRTYRYNRNGSHGGQSQCRLKHRHPQAKPEYVHKEHAVAESRHFGNEARRLRNADATEQQKRACRQRHAIKGAESHPTSMTGVE